jgi:hypothetical protein
MVPRSDASFPCCRNDSVLHGCHNSIQIGQAMIIALTSRRIDAIDAKQTRFPLQNVGLVKARVWAKFKELGATVLVCSAACGADLIALSEAGALGIRRKVILPFDRKRFRETSVVDRPGNWARLYDQIIDQVEAAGDLVIAPDNLNDGAYCATNRRILDEAILLGQHLHKPVAAMLIWEGASRGSDDHTAALGVAAGIRGLPVVEIRTDLSEVLK